MCKAKPYQSAKLNICRFKAQRQVLWCFSFVSCLVWVRCARFHSIWTHASSTLTVCFVWNETICKNLLIWMLCRRHRRRCRCIEIFTRSQTDNQTDTFDVSHRARSVHISETQNGIVPMYDSLFCESSTSISAHYFMFAFDVHFRSTAHSRYCTTHTHTTYKIGIQAHRKSVSI